MKQETLARRMFLILHDPFSGKPGVDIEPMKQGVVTAALADLVMKRRLRVADWSVTVLEPSPGGTDDVSELIIGSIKGGYGSDIMRSWVESFTDLVYELVARGLMADRVVRRQHGGRRVMRRNPDRFPALDLLRAAGPRVRLEYMLRSPHDMDLDGVVLAGIIHALHLDSVLDTDRDRAAVRSALATAVEYLPADLRGLIDGVTAAVTPVPLTFRRL